MKHLSLIIPLAVTLFVGCGEKKATEQASQTLTDSIQLNIAIGTGRVEPMDKVVMLSPEVPGTVSALLAQPGDSVKAGVPIILMHDETEQAQLKQVNAQIESQSNAVEVAKAQSELTQQDFKYLSSEADRIGRLKKDNAATEQALREAQNLSTQAASKLEAAKQAVLQSKSRLKELEVQALYFQTLCSKKKLLAPSDGIILSVEVRKGQFVNPGFNAVEFAPAGALSVWTEIDELLADQLKIGQKAIIRPQGATDTLSTATVEYVAPALRKKSLFSDQADNLEDRRVREVRVKLLNPRPGLLTGSRVECVIQLN